MSLLTRTGTVAPNEFTY